MTNITHTPGPWNISKHDDCEASIITAGHESIAFVYIDDNDKPATENNKADARLIAAAPELLDALTNERNGCIETIEYCQRYLKTLRDGLHNSGNRSAVESVEVVINNLKNLDSNARAVIAKARGAL